MPTLRGLLVWILIAGAARPAQPSVPPAPATPPLDTVALTSTATPRRTAEQLEQLLAPIALYPDALIALILPASTAPADIVLAARQLRESGSDRSQIEHRAWDESVKSLTHYPDVLKWMDENLEWTKQVGEAFAEQPVDVMQAVQRLRAQARAAGTLVDTPQQLVIAEPEVIRIVPAQPDTIYVPYYEPSLVFLPEPVWYGRPRVTFGVGLAVGSWLAFDCDWRRHTIWVGDRHRRWNGHDWRRPVVPIPAFGPGYARHPEVRPWRPPPPAARPPHLHPYRPTTEILRPGPATSPIVRHPPAPPPAPPANRPLPPSTFTRRSTPPPNLASEQHGPVNPAVPAASAPKNGSVRQGIEAATGAPPATTRRGPPERKPGTTPDARAVPESRRPTAPEHRVTPGTPPSRPAVAPPESQSRHAPPAPRSYSRSSPPSPNPSSGTPPPQARPIPPPPSAPASSPAAPPPRKESEGERSIGRRPATEQIQR